MPDRSRRQPVMVGICAGLAIAAAVACGSGAIEGPDGDGETIGFVLPLGNESAAGEAEQEVYAALSEGCAEGQAALDQDWSQLDSQRAVLIYQAAVEACNGNAEAARQYADAALDIDDGFARDSLECEVYRAVTGVTRQVDPSSVACGGGPEPTWPGEREPAERIDPRVAVAVDSTTTSTAEGSTTTSVDETTSTVDSSTTSSSRSPTTATSVPAGPDEPATG